MSALLELIALMFIFSGHEGEDEQSCPKPGNAAWPQRGTQVRFKILPCRVSNELQFCILTGQSGHINIIVASTWFILFI